MKAYLSNDILLLKTFSFLKNHDLIVLKKVCSKWRTLANELLHKRGESFGRMLFERGEWKFENANSNGLKYLCIEREHFLVEFKKDLDQMFSLSNLKKPIICIFFQTPDYFEHTNRIIQAKNMASLLPNDSLSLFVCSLGIIWENCLEYVGNTVNEDYREGDISTNKKILLALHPIPPVNPACGGVFFAPTDDYRFSVKSVLNLEPNSSILFGIRNENDLLQFLGE
jgi:hypothetical protein